MKTKVLTFGELSQAVQMLEAGKLVAFPTETVFGLGAIASDEAAVQAVFKAKGRPSDNPLIVHISSRDQVLRYAQSVNSLEEKLMATFWPGPLTIIFPLKVGSIASAVSPSGKTVALRMPQEDITLALIEKIGQGLVGPSANKSGKPSPTSLAHVLHDFEGEISGILDPGHPLLSIGIESTVVKVVENDIHILRPGAVTREMLEDLGDTVIEETVENQLNNPHLMSPGVKYRHYSPNQPVYLIRSENPIHFEEAMKTLGLKKYGLLADQPLVDALSQSSSWVAAYSYGARGDAKSAGKNLYAGLRYLENTQAEIILAQAFDVKGPYHAMMNRLSKAGTFF